MEIQIPIRDENFEINYTNNNLSNIDFSALDYKTSLRSITEYVATFYADKFNDFVESDPFIMLAEVASYINAIGSNRINVIANQLLFSNATDRNIVESMALLLGHIPTAPTPALAKIVCDLGSIAPYDIQIPAGTTITTKSQSGVDVTYMLYKSDIDTSNPITIPSGKRNVVALGIEGSTKNITATFNQFASYEYEIQDNAAYASPIVASVDNVNWKKVTKFDSTLENKNQYIVYTRNKKIILKFSDGSDGVNSPNSQSIINITYRSGNASNGKISRLSVNQVVSVSQNSAQHRITLSNPEQSLGGVDYENINSIKSNTGKMFYMHNNITTGSDYLNAAVNYSHEIYGNAYDAVATTNGNSVTLYVICNDGTNFYEAPQPLLIGIKTYIDNINGITDNIIVENADMKYIDLDISVLLDSDSKPASIQNLVDNIVNSYFLNIKIGQSLQLYDIIKLIGNIDGVKKVAINSPLTDLNIPQDYNINTIFVLSSKRVKLLV